MLTLSASVDHNNAMANITLKTKRCMFCGKDGNVEVTLEHYEMLVEPDRPHIQDIMPEVPAEIREQIISGTHPACWDEFVKLEED